MAAISMKALLEAGVHFGHRTRRWNPKMKPYIFTERNGIHILDLQQTLAKLDEAYNLVRVRVAAGGTVLFVGTKKQAQTSIVEESARCGMPFVNQRWLGGTLTNFPTIRQRIDYMIQLEGRKEVGEFDQLVKKEALQFDRLIAKLQRRLGGLREMRKLPDVVFITDVRRENLAVREANILNIPVIAIVDTNCDPDPIDLAIPSNDDAIRTIRLMTSRIADAVIEGRAVRQAEEEAVAAAEAEEAMGEFLGPSTLAKLRTGAFDELEVEDFEDEHEVEAVAGKDEGELTAEIEEATTSPEEQPDKSAVDTAAPEAATEDETSAGDGAAAEQISEATDAVAEEAEKPEA